MRDRHAKKRAPGFGQLPRAWLFTDERAGDPLPLLDRLPRGSGIIFRHYWTPQRLGLARRLARRARRRGQLLVIADRGRGREPFWADGRHLSSQDLRRGACGRAHGPRRLLTAAVHSDAELTAAARAGADLAFLSPVFPTRSHAGGRTLGRLRFALIARRSRLPVAALGGMNPGRFRHMRPLGAVAWGAIDYWCRPRE